MSAQSHDIYSAAVYIQLLGPAAATKALESHKTQTRLKERGERFALVHDLGLSEKVKCQQQRVRMHGWGLLDSWECRKIEWHGKLVFVNLYLLFVYCICIFFVDWYYFFVNCKTSIAEYYTYDFVIFCQLLNYSLV